MLGNITLKRGCAQASNEYEQMSLMSKSRRVRPVVVQTDNVINIRS